MPGDFLVVAPGPSAWLFREEGEHDGVKLVGMGGIDGLRNALDEVQFAAVDGFTGALAADLERDRAVAIAVDD